MINLVAYFRNSLSKYENPDNILMENLRRKV